MACVAGNIQVNRMAKTLSAHPSPPLCTILKVGVDSTSPRVQPDVLYLEITPLCCWQKRNPHAPSPKVLQESVNLEHPNGQH